MRPLPHLPLPELIQSCQQQTANFIRTGISDTQYCYELFRRALAERDPDAINAVYDVYRPMLERWASKNPLIELTHETPQYFGLMAFRSLQAAIHPQKMAEFKELSHILKYLSMCVDTSIRQYVRQHQPDELLHPDHDPGYSPNFEASLGVHELWQYICKLLEDDKSILMARFTYIYHMKPQEIVELHKDIWPDTKAVRVHRQRIKRKLHADPKLKRWHLH